MYKPCEHKTYFECMYSREFETICTGNCGLCQFPYLFGNIKRHSSQTIMIEVL